MNRRRTALPKIGRPQKPVEEAGLLVILQPVLSRVSDELRELNYPLPKDALEFVEFFGWCSSEALSIFSRSRRGIRTRAAPVRSGGPSEAFAQKYPAAYHAAVFAFASEFLGVENDELAKAVGARWMNSANASEKLTVREQNIGRKLRKQAAGLAVWKRHVVECFCTTRTATKE